VDLAAVFLTAVLVRVIALWSLNSTLYTGSLIADEHLYDLLAKAIAFKQGVAPSLFLHDPFPAYLIAGLYKLFGSESFFTRILNLLLGSATCIFIYLTAKSLGDRKSGILAGIISVVCAPLILYSIVPLKTALSLFLFSLLLMIMVQYIQHPSAGSCFSMGFVVSLACLTRSNYYINAAALVFIISWVELHRSRSVSNLVRSSIFFMLGLTLGFLPITLHYKSISPDTSGYTSQLAINFYHGNNLAAETPFITAAPFTSPFPAEQNVHFTIEASRRAGEKLSGPESSRFWITETIRQARENPGEISIRLLQKFLATFGSGIPTDHYRIKFISRDAWFFRLPLAGFTLIFPLAVVGFISRIRIPEMKYSILFMLLLYSGTLVIFHVLARYRTPLLLGLIPLAGVGAFALKDLIQDLHRKKFLQVCVAFFFALAISHIPLPGKRDMTYQLNHKAYLLEVQGKRNKARDYWQKSAEANGLFSDYARMIVAEYAIKEDSLKHAEKVLREIRDSGPAGAYKYSMLGDIYLLRGELSSAEEYFIRSVGINSGLTSVYEKLIDINSRVDPKKSEELYKNYLYIQSFYRP
jgi:4-amino-4-deoxy-L-arabinose transferase-like glycosyltransferase